VLYDDATLGEEDLEEFEVQDAIDSFDRDQWAEMGEDHLQRATRRRLYLQTQQISSPAMDAGTNEDGNKMEESSVRKGFREVEGRLETPHKEYTDIDDELEGLSQVSERKSVSKNKQEKKFAQVILLNNSFSARKVFLRCVAKVNEEEVEDQVVNRS